MIPSEHGEGTYSNSVGFGYVDMLGLDAANGRFVVGPLQVNERAQERALLPNQVVNSEQDRIGRQQRLKDVRFDD